MGITSVQNKNNFFLLFFDQSLRVFDLDHSVYLDILVETIKVCLQDHVRTFKSLTFPLQSMWEGKMSGPIL